MFFKCFFIKVKKHVFYVSYLKSNVFNIYATVSKLTIGPIHLYTPSSWCHHVGLLYLNQLVPVSDLPSRRRLRSSSTFQQLVPSYTVCQPLAVAPFLLQPQPFGIPYLFMSSQFTILPRPISTFRQRLKHSRFVYHFSTSLFNTATLPWTSKWLGTDI